MSIWVFTYVRQNVGRNCRRSCSMIQWTSACASSVHCLGIHSHVPALFRYLLPIPPAVIEVVNRYCPVHFSKICIEFVTNVRKVRFRTFIFIARSHNFKPFSFYLHRHTGYTDRQGNLDYHYRTGRARNIAQNERFSQTYLSYITTSRYPTYN